MRSLSCLPHFQAPRRSALRALVAAACGAAPMLVVPALAAEEQAGVTAAVRGRIEIATVAGAVGRLARSGEPNFLGNSVRSGPDSGLQILLLDQTTFTIGPDSELVIDTFVYDPAKASGKLTASIVKGVFRFVTGKVAESNPENMTVKLPVGTIGIRGTMALGRVQPQDAGAPLRQEVALLGPGRDRDGRNRVGALVLAAGGGEVTLDRSGFGSTFAGGAWGEPVHWPPERLAELQALLTPGGANSNAATGPGETANGPPGANPNGPAASGATGTEGAVTDFGTLRDDASTDRTRNQALMSMLSGGSGSATTSMIPDGASTFDQLRTVTTGQFFYQGSAALSGGGSYTLYANINFGARTFGGGNSRVDVNGPNYSGSLAIPSSAYANSAGNASFNQTGVTGITGSGCQQGCRADIALTPQNQGGVAGATLAHQVTVRATIFSAGPPVQQTIGQGSGTATRNPGVAP